LLIACLSISSGAPNVQAYEIKVYGERFSLQAERASLQDILKDLSDRTGIIVRIDPALNPSISANFKDRPLQQALESILKSLNYVLLWESIPTSGGTVTRMKEIQVFEPGRQDLMQALGVSRNLQVVRNPDDGSFYVAGEILVRLKPGTDVVSLEALIRPSGGTVIAVNQALGLYRLHWPPDTEIPALVKELIQQPIVSKAEPNYAYPIGSPFRDDQSISAGSTLNLTEVPAGSVPVAVLDSGMLSKPELNDYVSASLDAIDPAQPISDGLGHGTQMALVAAGVVKPYGVLVGSDTANPVIPVRIFDDNGFTSNYSLMRGIDFALQRGAKVMSLSWGSQTQSAFLQEAFSYAASKGLIIVASAGNEPTGQAVYPAAYEGVIGVGALAPDGQKWQNSNFGNFVELYAPGFADMPVGYKGDPGLYAGTSIAAAFVANQIAVFLSQNPQATREEILSALQQAAKNATPQK
jgi:hypothetical protein